MLFHIPQLICPLKGVSNWKRGMLTEEQALQIPHKLQRAAAADEQLSNTAPWGHRVPFLWGFKSHLGTFTPFQGRRANSVPRHCSASGWWDRTESTIAPSPHACCKKHCPGLSGAESGLQWNCSEQSYESSGMRGSQHMEQTAPKKGPNYLTGFKWSVQRQGSCRQLLALFSVPLTHEITCLVEALWLSGFRGAARGPESDLYKAQHK